jgi:hypothetical protein
VQALRIEGHEQCGCPHSLVLHPQGAVMIRHLMSASALRSAVVSLCDIYLNTMAAAVELVLS